MTRIPRANVTTGWRCFHCDEYFTGEQRAEAAEHFGISIYAEPACKLREAEGGLVKIIRDQAERIRRCDDNDTPLHRALAALQGERERDLRIAEETGYGRGLRDGRLMPWGDFSP